MIHNSRLMCVGDQDGVHRVRGLGADRGLRRLLHATGGTEHVTQALQALNRLSVNFNHLLYSMVHILDGGSEIGACVRNNFGYLICLRHLISSRAVTFRIFFSPQILIFLHTCATCFEPLSILLLWAWTQKVYTVCDGEALTRILKSKRPFTWIFKLQRESHYIPDIPLCSVIFFVYFQYW